MTVVVMLSVTVVWVVSIGCVEATPGQFICPANAEADSSRVRTATAHVWRKVFIVRSLLVEK